MPESSLGRTVLYWWTRRCAHCACTLSHVFSTLTMCCFKGCGVHKQWFVGMHAACAPTLDHSQNSIMSYDMHIYSLCDALTALFAGCLQVPLTGSREGSVLSDRWRRKTSEGLAAAFGKKGGSLCPRSLAFSLVGAPPPQTRTKAQGSASWRPRRRP